MNIFMPEETIAGSVEALDDKRLIKQILECKTILDVALDETKKGYARHPVVVYYKDYPKFVSLYGAIACEEYVARFGEGQHTFYEHFMNLCKSLPLLWNTAWR